MEAQQLNLDNIAHNIANANTTGYKMRRAQFQDLLYQNLIQPGSAAGQQTTVPTGLQLGLGTRAASNEIIFSPGNFTATENPFDMAIQGGGFFQVRLQSGDIAYSRAGAFHVDRDGNLVTADGDPLDPPVTIPQDALNVSIAQDGTVSFTQPGQTAAQLGGEIQLALFQNPAGLNSIGRNLYLQTDASGEPIIGTPGGQEGLGSLLQGYLEDSNVSVVQEFINMIVSQRAYEANSKVVKAADEMYQQINNLTR